MHTHTMPKPQAAAAPAPATPAAGGPLHESHVNQANPTTPAPHAPHAQAAAARPNTMPQALHQPSQPTRTTRQQPGPRQPEPLAPRFMGVPRKLMQAISGVVIAAIVNTSLVPLVHAQQAKRAQAAQAEALAEAAAPSAAEHYQNALQALKADVLGTGTNSTTTRNAGSAASADTFEAAAHKLRQEWAALNAQWQNAGVAPQILARQAALQAEFEHKHSELMAALDQAAEQPAGTAQHAALASFLADNAPSPTHLPVNLANLPWQTEQPKPQAPASTPQALQARLAASLPTAKVAKAAGAAKTAPGNTAQPLISHRQAIAIESEASPNSTAPTLTRAGQPATTKAATQPTAADLAATPEAPHTPEIQALAASLGRNPHKIYQWVHDNIHYVPTQGSVQGAQDTLDKKAGNAFDQASLLTALLRASGIPSRYIYGTIELPVAQVQNWVGGTHTADAAQQILAQGGVPNTILTKGGQDWAFRMEHVWVESFIEYHPHRGAKHKPGVSSATTWVPMDASFKQYTFSQGMDLQTAVPLDANALLAAAQQGAEVNEAEGWVRGLNTSALQSQLAAYQSRLKTHIDSQNAGQSTVGDVLGSRQAKIDPLPYLAGTLPYTVKATSQPFSSIPANQQARFQYEIYADQRSAAWGDSPLLSWQTPTAAIAGKKVTIAWVAASPAAQAAIEALIPTPPAGQELDPSQLPQGLPASIALKPEIRVDGKTVATGYALSAGSEPLGQGSFTRYGDGQWDTTTDQLIAGQQSSLGISIQGISQVQLETLKARMEATKQKLEQAAAAPEAQRPAILNGITGENLTGDMLTATMWGYFAALQSYGAISGNQAGVIDLPALSYGLFHAQVKPNKLFGMVTTGIRFQGLNMDIGHIRSVRWVKDDNPQSAINNKPELTANGKTAAQNRWIAYNKSKGQNNSAMEHGSPEQFWVDKSQCRYQDHTGQTQNPSKADCAEAISAVKAIAIAQAEGQKIYTINQSNAATALPKLTIGGAVGSEIRSAIQAGKEVTFHESPINAHGWTGYGYIMIDPDTGAGAYIIEGKGNGGIFLAFGTAYGFALGYTLVMLDAAIASKAAPAVMGPIVAALALELASIALIWKAYGDLYGEFYQGCFVQGIGIGMAASNVAIGVLEKLSGAPLPGGAVTGRFISMLIVVAAASVPTSTLGQCSN